MPKLVRIGYEWKIFYGASYLSDPGNVTPTGAVEDKCHYSNWTSCSYFCGDEKEDYSYRALMDDTPKARAECPIPKKPCDESVVCTGDIYRPEHSEASFFLFFTSALCIWSVDENQQVQWELREEGKDVWAENLYAHLSTQIML